MNSEGVFQAAEQSLKTELDKLVQEFPLHLGGLHRYIEQSYRKLIEVLVREHFVVSVDMLCSSVVQERLFLHSEMRSGWLAFLDAAADARSLQLGEGGPLGGGGVGKLKQAAVDESELVTFCKCLNTTVKSIADGLIDREHEAALLVLASLGEEHLLLLGPPGVGKSMLAERLLELLAGSKGGAVFSRLLTKFSDPDELFGPPSFKDLKKGRDVRLVANYLPTAEVAFLDEIFKSNSAILNALMTVLNERRYHNGTRELEIPLRVLVAASNEYPPADSPLQPMYDRFLLRTWVGPLSTLDDYAHLADLGDNQQRQKNHAGKISRSMAKAAKDAASKVVVPRVVRVLLFMVDRYAALFKRTPISPRRTRGIIKMLRLLAMVRILANGVDAHVPQTMTVCMEDSLWAPHMSWTGHNDLHDIRLMQQVAMEQLVRLIQCDVPMKLTSPLLLQKESSIQNNLFKRVMVAATNAADVRFALGSPADELLLQVQSGQEAGLLDALKIDAKEREYLTVVPIMVFPEGGCSVSCQLVTSKQKFGIEAVVCRPYNTPSELRWTLVQGTQVVLHKAARDTWKPTASRESDNQLTQWANKSTTLYCHGWPLPVTVKSEGNGNWILDPKIDDAKFQTLKLQELKGQDANTTLIIIEGGGDVPPVGKWFVAKTSPDALDVAAGKYTLVAFGKNVRVARVTIF